MDLAKKTVDRMMELDLFSQWLGIEVLDVKEGYSKIKMAVRPEMVNGFGIAHGGIAFSLADSAFAFAFVEGILQLQRHLPVKGVQFFRTVQGDDGHRVFHLV